MSVLFVCGVFDGAVQAYGRPIFVPAKGAAMRSFADEVNRRDQDSAQNALNAHPEDFELYWLGLFDEATGQFHPPEGGIPQLLSRGKDVIRDA